MSSSEGIKDGATGGSSGVWEKLMSKKHQAFYWFNSASGESSWVDPNPEEISESVSKRRRVDGDADVPANSGTRDNTDTRRQIDSSSSGKAVPSSSSTTASATSSASSSAVRPEVRPDIAIIVPYRDLHEKQKRKKQLDRFIPEITTFMELNKHKQSKLSYRIYIIEQSNDERKFNRGKLLNIGFKIACAEGCKALIFHDVDLVPSKGILYSIAVLSLLFSLVFLSSSLDISHFFNIVYTPSYISCYNCLSPPLHSLFPPTLTHLHPFLIRIAGVLLQDPCRESYSHREGVG